MKTLAALAIVLSLALCLAACGGGGSTSTGSATGAPLTVAPPPDGGSAEAAPGPLASAFHPKAHHDSGGGSGQFLVEGGDDSVQRYGVEAGEAEFRRAAGALHDFLDARAERNWAAACAYLARPVIEDFARLGSGQSCAAALAALTGKVPTEKLREAALADVGALRVRGAQGFVLYRGIHRVVLALPMRREGGEWRVASLSGVPLG